MTIEATRQIIHALLPSPMALISELQPKMWLCRLMTHSNITHTQISLIRVFNIVIPHDTISKMTVEDIIDLVHQKLQPA